MSIPSSSAFVATTPRTAPSRRPRSMRGARSAGSRRGSRRIVCGSPGLVGATSRAGSVSSSSTAYAARRERDGLHAGADEPRRDVARGLEERCADAELLVDDRRVVDDDDASPGRRAVVVHELDVVVDERCASSAGLAIVAEQQDEDGGRSRRTGRCGAAGADVGDVAAEHAAVRVQLVDDDELEVLEELDPLRVVRKDGRVEHVRVRDHDVPGGAHRAAGVGRRVAVVGEGLQSVAERRRERRAARRAGPGRAPWWGTGRARAWTGRERRRRGRAGCSRASCPGRGRDDDHVAPGARCSIAFAWCVYGRSMPRRASAAMMRASTPSGHSA